MGIAAAQTQSFNAGYILILAPIFAAMWAWLAKRRMDPNPTLKFGLGLEWFVYFCFSAALIVLAFIDADHRILPDEITINGIWIGIVASLMLMVPSPVAGVLLRFAGIEAASPEGRRRSHRTGGRRRAARRRARC